MNKAELIKSIEQTLGSRKAAADALDAVLDAIVREVSKGGKVAITGFGTFEKAARAARTGRNPQTGEPVKIPKTNVPRFKAATSFKSYVANPKSLPKAAPAVARAAGASGAAGSRSRLSSSALTATRNDDPDIDRAAISGRSTRPKAGSNTPAAMGSAMAL